MTITDPLRPLCLKCRRPLKKSGGTNSPRWVCSRCGINMGRRRERRRNCQTPPKRPTIHPLPIEIIDRPVCLGCRREM